MIPPAPSVGLSATSQAQKVVASVLQVLQATIVPQEEVPLPVTDVAVEEKAFSLVPVNHMALVEVNVGQTLISITRFKKSKDDLWVWTTTRFECSFW